MTKSFKYIQAMKIAAEAAAVAHEGQHRKHGIVPFIAHPARVAQLVMFYDNTAYLSVITAWMHDVLEDCGEKGAVAFNTALAAMPLDTMEKIQVRLAVEALTKNDNLHPRQAKWDDCISRLVDDDTPPLAVLVKICDRIDNLMDLEKFQRSFILMYIDETDQLIAAIDRLLLNSAEKEAFNNLKNVRNYIATNI